MWVFVPTPEAFEKGTNLKKLLAQRWKPPRNYFHLRRGGHVAALRSHLLGTVFAHVDIKGFFASINRTRVTRSLKRFLPYDDARDWANESTVVVPSESVRRYVLPFGFVQSPILASLSLYDSALGKTLRKVQKEFGVVVSVYVDDIVVSSIDEECLSEAMSWIKSAAARSGFCLNDKKEQGPAARVNAFNITLSSGGLAIEASRMAEFMKAFENSTSDDQRRGLLGYVASVNPAQAKKLELMWP